VAEGAGVAGVGGGSMIIVSPLEQKENWIILKKKIECICQLPQKINKQFSLQEFAVIRNECPALREVLIPDHEWLAFQQKAKELPDGAGHTFKVIGALQLGILGKITSPIHKYLFEGGHLKESFIKSGYRNALIEHWLNEPTPMERHQKARGHEGKINELLCASWLDNQGWSVFNLEALGGSFDIEATSPSKVAYSIEVKYIGQEDNKFQIFMQSCLTGEAVAATFSVYDGFNYFLFKIYEAAYQLQKQNNNDKHLVFIIFSHDAWKFNSMHVNDNWIERYPIEFCKNASDNWRDFLAKKKKEKRYQQIESTLVSCIKKIDEIWIIQQQSDLEYSLEKLVKLNN
jgi:hypothetical protein